MIPELGHFALVAAFAISLLLSVVPLIGAGHFSRKFHSVLLMGASFWLSISVFAVLSASIIFLGYAFWTDDFSVLYVANNSNLELPRRYKISALWSAHEGSLLLWVWLLSLWMAVVAVRGRMIPLPMAARTMAVMGMICSGFLAFMLFTSNPFLRALPFAPLDGKDLNPLLQDFGLIVHPPTLYVGYVGFSVAFAFAIASLLQGSVDRQWLRWMRPWVLCAWLFLTLGIILGSWWAYYELGWGGWWFWDPVENASFMPWLAGTALLHSLAVTEKRGVFKSWTLLLAILVFSLSLLGTFLVRSGVLTSVHAFASDPSRGYFILIFLALVIGGSLTLYALKADQLVAEGEFEPVSRESAVLLNNSLLVLVMLIILLGTLYPLIADALSLGKISVGPPYFNFFFLPLMGLLVLFMPVGAALQWRSDSLKKQAALRLEIMGCSLLSGLVMTFLYGGAFNFFTVLSVTLVMWLILLTLVDLYYRLCRSGGFFVGIRKLSGSHRGMVVAHLGVALTTAGISLTSIYSQSKDVRMDVGVPVHLAEMEFVFHGAHPKKGENYSAHVAQVSVLKEGKQLAVLKAEKRLYNSDRGNRMTEAGIYAGFFADLYISMGEPIDPDAPSGPWAMRLHHKPFVRWIWLGGLMMVLGAGLSMSDRRYRAVQIFASTDDGR